MPQEVLPVSDEMDLFLRQQPMSELQRQAIRLILGIDTKYDNYLGEGPPTADDDALAGYSVGSKWYDTIGKEAYFCVDATQGAAVWEILTLSSDDLGSAAFLNATADGATNPGIVLKTDANGKVAVSEIDVTNLNVIGTLTANHIHGNIAGSLYAHVRAGENLAKGDPVYVSGSHGSGSTLISIVSKADAANASKMPAVGVMDAAVAANSNGHMVIAGSITEFNTVDYPVNAELYVANGGGLTVVPPSASSQPVGRVERSNANNGAFIVGIAGWASNGGNGTADANKLVRFGSAGTIPIASVAGSRSGIDSRTSFPNSTVNGATSVNTPGTLVRRDNSGGAVALGDVTAGSVVADGTVSAQSYSSFFDYKFLRMLPGAVLANLSLTAAITADRLIVFPDASGTLLLSGNTLGIPSSGTLTNCVGLPVTTGLAGLGSGVATFLATPTSTNLAAALTDEAGASGGFVRVEFLPYVKGSGNGSATIQGFSNTASGENSAVAGGINNTAGVSVEKIVLLADNFNEVNTSTSTFNSNLLSTQSGTLAAVPYNITGNVLHGGNNNSLRVQNNGVIGTVFPARDFSVESITENKPIQLSFRINQVSGFSDPSEWVMVSIANEAPRQIGDPTVIFGCLFRQNKDTQFFSAGAQVTSIPSTTWADNDKITFLLSDTAGTGSPHVGNGCVAKLYKNDVLIGTHTVVGLSDNFLVTFAGPHYNPAAPGIALFDDLEIALVNTLADKSVVAGGNNNKASSRFTTVGGGDSNTATGTYSTIAGGRQNTANGARATVGGGRGNIANGVNSTIAGGRSNIASNYDSTVAGGSGNIAKGSGAFIGGGTNLYDAGTTNRANGYCSVIGGGTNNLADSDYSFVGNGKNNAVTGNFSSVVAGQNNTNSRSNSHVIGSNITATEDDTTYVENLNIKGVVTQTSFDIGNSGTAVTISLANGAFQRVTLTGNCNFTMPPAVVGRSFTLQVRTGSGGFTGAFAGVRWSGNVAPNITTTAGRMDTISFISDGSNWYGSINQNFFV